MVTAPLRPSDGYLYGHFVDSGMGRALTKVQDPAILANVLYLQQRANVVPFFDDFNVVTMNGDPWTKTKDAGATDFAISAAVNGMIRGITGTSNTEGLSITGPAIYSGSRNCGMEARIKISLLTNVTWEMSWIDDITDKTAPACTDVDTPAFGAGLTEGASVTQDTGETITTPRLCTKGATSSVLAATMMTPPKTQTVNSDITRTAYAPTADTYFTVRLQVFTPKATNGTTANTISSVEASIFDSSDPKNIKLVSQEMIKAEEGANVLGGITAATLIRPYFAIATLNGTSKNYDIDYIAIWQDR